MNFKKFGKYTIIKKIASGGMADILLANDLNPTGFGRFVVIKRALSKFSDNEEFKDMFKNEGKVACNLKHRNITPIYEFGIENNQFFLSMEYVSGRNVRELIKKLQAYKHTINIPNAVHIIKEVASGLNYAHNAIDSNTGQPLNLIHRDVSPQNIMLSFDGEIKLIDFGIAKIADTNLTRAGHLKGKFSYMSPEQAYGEVVDERTDIFCLGIILWELLTDKRLFASQNELTSLKKVKNCDIPDAQKISPEIPTELNNIINKALSKNKNSRYKTAAKLEQDLSVFLNKNYTEYSHYDFIALMKKVYRKEIMNEREKLKTYSSAFKKYLNALNIEESLVSQNINLNIPELWTEEISKQKGTGSELKETKSLLQNENSLLKGENPLSEYVSHFQTHTKSQFSELQSKTMKENSTTLIQRKENDTENTEIGEKITKTKRTFTKTNPIKPNLQKTNPESLILRNEPTVLKSQIEFLKATQNKTFSTLSNPSKSYNKKEHLYETEDTGIIKKKKKIFHFVFFLFIIGSFISAVYLINSNYDIIDLVKNKKLQIKPMPATPFVKKQAEPVEPSTTLLKDKRQPSSANTQNISANKKVFIKSKPSGAGIFINGKFSSKYTPSLINLPLNNVRITLKKQGYFSKTFAFDSKQNKHSLNINLTTDHKQNTASEQIEIIQ